jgi:hypothetical protein
MKLKKKYETLKSSKYETFSLSLIKQDDMYFVVHIYFECAEHAEYSDAVGFEDLVEAAICYGRQLAHLSYIV